MMPPGDHEIGRAEHDGWFAGALSLTDRRYWIIARDGEDVGLANLTRIRSGQPPSATGPTIPGETLDPRPEGSAPRREYIVLEEVVRDPMWA